MTSSLLAEGYGALLVAGLHLALPIAAIREVLPAGAPVPVPSTAPGVVGGINLRGVVLPVLDLACCLGRPPVEGGCVLVMVHEGRVLGLRLDAVAGIFSAVPGSLRRIAATDPLAAVYQASVRRADTDEVVSLLSPAAIFALPGMPLLEDPEPERHRHVDAHTTTDVAAAQPQRSQVLLLAAGGLPFAIDAMAVFATVANPVIGPSPLRHGICRGVTEFAGHRIPVIDLLGLCGLGTGHAGEACQSFLVRVPSGLVCLLVDQVIDVVCADLERAISLPKLGTAEPALFRGMLPAGALPEAVRALAPTGDGHYLLLDGLALQASPRLDGLAAANAGRSGDPRAVGNDNFFKAVSSDAGHRALLVFDLQGRTATPLSQIREILPWQPGALQLQGHGALLALLVNRGQTVPVMGLARLLGLPDVPLDLGACILVVDQADGVMGFAVARLYDIETADWESSESGHGFAAGADPAVRALSSRAVAMTGGGSDARLLRVLDLEAMAASLVSPEGA